MSHIVKINMQVKSLDALESACKILGLELVRNQKSFKYFANQSGQCDHVIRIPGNSEAYEIGVVRNADHFELLWDHYAGGKGMVAMVSSDGKSPNVNKLKQAYTTSVTISQLQRQGLRVTQSKMADGRIRIQAVS